MQKVFAGQMQNADHGLALAPVRRPAIADGQDMSEELLANRPARRQRRVPRKGLAQRLECRKGASGITSRLGAVPNDLLNEPVDADRIPDTSASEKRCREPNASAKALRWRGPSPSTRTANRERGMASGAT